MSKEILWYDLVPHYKPEPGKGPFMVTAALRKCIVTGETLDTSGGPGFSVGKTGLDLIHMTKYGATPKAIIEVEDLETLLDFAERLGHDDPKLVELVESLKRQINLD